MNAKLDAFAATSSPRTPVRTKFHRGEGRAREECSQIHSVPGVGYVYQCTSPSGHTNYETWKHMLVDGVAVAPRSSRWGIEGWTLTSEERAMEKLEEIGS